ncbi:TonB-dependent receptor [Aurantibacter crassamenti]|uniref:SusC/RagA family TonB-linked outer membrane protein n=1 Tax=Aurantibacter crassamenti TaxID=1837375 RepID=UPI001939DD9F|nr:TonB-dependent receptor [Aurantibacter crassamenti]MBM1105805.1 TonB-dependent receptor [Aurantibacter crassamenti]
MIKFKMVFFLLLAIGIQNVYSQSNSINGTVLDDQGVPLPGASVIEKGTSNGTQTDFDGNFNISVNANAVLVVSYIGFVTQEASVGNQSNISIQLDTDTNLLDEVVVVGYGTQSRAEVSGAISTIKSEELTATPVTNAESALQGRAAGVTVISNGSPGSAPEVRIRGLGTMNNSSPLFVIDGVISTTGLAGLNPGDIDNINILKDASTTAIYGSLGSNGVVMVTTKKGTKSNQVTVNFESYTGIQFITNRYDVLNTDQYLQYANDAYGITPNTPGSRSGLNTNWQDELFTTGIMQNYDLSIAGGNENSNYRFSGNFQDQDGAVIETGYKRYSFRANSNFTVGKLSLGETLAVSFDRQTPEGSLGTGRSLIEHAIKMPPYLSVYNSSNLGGFQGPSSANDGQDAENPVRIQRLGEYANKGININGSVFGDYEILEGLKFKSQLGLIYQNYLNESFTPAYNDDSENSGTGTQVYAGIVKNTGITKDVIFTNSLNYTKSFNDVHNLDFLLLYERQDGSRSNINTSSRNELSNTINEISNQDSQISSQSFEYTRVSFLGRLNYNFDQRYIFAASMRRDASSRFGANNRWGWFPSLAAGWNIAKESFLEDSSFSTLKLRGSWGVVGNDRIRDYAYTSSLSPNFNYPFDGGNSVGVTVEGIANADIKWEETNMTNIGLDIGLMNEKVTMALEYYNNRSNDLLMDLQLPDSHGFLVNSISSNVGSVETKGFELSLGFNDFEGDFTWSANLNLGTAKNETISLGGLEEVPGGSFENENLTRLAPGESLFHFYGKVTDGVYDTQAEVDEVFWSNTGQTGVQPGDIRFKDINNDGDINADDRTVLGNAFPDLTYGLNLSAAYKSWDFNAFISGVSGNSIYNTNIYDLEGMPRLFNSGTAVLNRWTGPGTSNTVPRAFGSTQNVSASDRFIEDGSYTRLKNISIGYTIKNTALNEYISKLRVYLSAQNMLTFTNYSGLDPEIGNPNVANGGTNFEVGIDRGNYPQPKSILTGIQVSF